MVNENVIANCETQHSRDQPAAPAKEVSIGNFSTITDKETILGKCHLQVHLNDSKAISYEKHTTQDTYRKKSEI